MEGVLVNWVFAPTGAQGAELRSLPEAARTVSREGQNASLTSLREAGLFGRESESSWEFADFKPLTPSFTQEDVL